MDNFLHFRVWFKVNGRFNNKIIYGPTIKTPSDALAYFKNQHGIRPSHAGTGQIEPASGIQVNLAEALSLANSVVTIHVAKERKERE